MHNEGVSNPVKTTFIHNSSTNRTIWNWCVWLCRIMYRDHWLREGKLTETTIRHVPVWFGLQMVSPEYSGLGFELLGCEAHISQCFMILRLTQSFGHLLSFQSPPWPGCKCAAQIRMSKLTASYQRRLIVVKQWESPIQLLFVSSAVLHNHPYSAAAVINFSGLAANFPSGRGCSHSVVHNVGRLLTLRRHLLRIVELSMSGSHPQKNLQ